MGVKKLLHNLVIIIQEDMADLEKGGLSIPASAEDTPRHGRVVHAGTKCETVKEGDLILYKAQAGEDIFIDAVPHLLMTEKEIVAIV